MDWFLERARSLGVEHRPPAPILLGRHLLALGLTPGPRVGEILKAVYEQQMDGTVTDLDQAIAAAETGESVMGQLVSRAVDCQSYRSDQFANSPIHRMYNGTMSRYTLVYGVRLIPEGSVKDLEEGTAQLADGSAAGLTLHTIDGTIPQLRRALDRSLDAFFDLLPGADADDLETFGD